MFHIEAWDVNCTQHIQPRYTVDEMQPMVQGLHDRIEGLEARNRALESQFAATSAPVLSRRRLRQSQNFDQSPVERNPGPLHLAR